jgi:hypothetical protein
MGLARIVRLGLLSATLFLVFAQSASAGRLIESGHDPEWHCVVQVGGPQCRFVRIALNYVRAGAPNPTKPVLVLDRPGLNGTLANLALDKAFGPGVVPRTVVDPRSVAFATTPIDTAHWSAIWIASDKNCGGCDLNEAPSGSPLTANTPDSTAIAARTDDIAAFFNGGGGLMVGAGAQDSGGFPSGPAFNAANQPYYSFVATSGADNAVAPFTLTSLGTSLGFTSADINCGCGTHNSFGSPPAGSRLKTVERDNSGRFVTLVEDTDPPVASITSRPNGLVASTSATFGFRSNEAGSFQCSVDNGSYSACSSPKTVSGIPAGKHTFNVRAIDLVGNIQPTPTSATFCLPGGSEITGNKVDEDCSGFADPFDRIDSTIRYSFRFTRTASLVSTMNLSNITPRSGTKLKVTCKGKGCPFKSKSVRIRRGRAKLSGIFKKRRHRAKLRKGVKIQISLTRSRTISKVYLFKIRRAALPNFDTRCSLPGSRKLRSTCPPFG